MIREHGPLTAAMLGRLYPMKPASRQRILQDLDRFGFIAGYRKEHGRSIIKVTDKPWPVDDWDDTPDWPRKTARGARGEWH